MDKEKLLRFLKGFVVSAKEQIEQMNLKKDMQDALYASCATLVLLIEQIENGFFDYVH